MNESKSKLTTCKTCGKEIAISANACPHCGANNKKANGCLIALFVFLATMVSMVIMVLIITNIYGGFITKRVGESSEVAVSTEEKINVETTEETSDETVEEEKPKKKQKFEFVGDLSSESDQFATYISGVLQNNTDKEYVYCQITFKLYDAEGNMIGTALANVNNFEAGGKWKFKAMGMGKAASYKFSEITSF